MTWEAFQTEPGKSCHSFKKARTHLERYLGSTDKARKPSLRTGLSGQRGTYMNPTEGNNGLSESELVKSVKEL